MNQTNTITLTFQVSKMNLTAFLAQLVFILRVKLIRGKIYFLKIFVHFFSKCTFLICCWIFFLPSGYFSVAVRIYKICVFDEIFFLLTIRMLMIIKLFRVVTCYKELSSIDIHGISTEWSCGVMWQIKYISSPAEDAWTQHKARCLLSIRGSQTWPFDQVTNMRSHDCFKNLYLYIHEVYS